MSIKPMYSKPHYILCLLIANLLIFSMNGQSLERAVISSTGNSTLSTSFYLESTVGEMAVGFSNSTNYVLQAGFQQGSSLLVFDSLDFSIDIFNTSCEGYSDGSAIVSNINGCIAPYQISFSDGSVDSTQTGLLAGIHQVTVIGFNGCSLTKSFEIGTEPLGFCDLVFYSGFTPNGDNVNDLWLIDNITNYPENTLTIYNRYGEKVNQFKNYDNSTVVWDGSNLNDKLLPGATYFYVLESGSQIKKGWVELTK